MTKAEAKDIVKELRANGGPLATRAAKALSWALKQVPGERTPPGELHPLRLRVIHIKQQTVRTNRPEKEARDWKNWLKRAETPEDDIALLEKFYSLKDPAPGEPFDERNSRKKSLPLIFANLSTMIDLAVALRDSKPWLFRDKAVTKNQLLAEPEGWQAHAPGNLGRKSWHQLCKEYATEAKEIYDAINGSSPGKIHGVHYL